ncbi:DUF7241 domain-containing protein [Microbacterium sp. HJ5]
MSTAAEIARRYGWVPGTVLCGHFTGTSGTAAQITHRLITAVGEERVLVRDRPSVHEPWGNEMVAVFDDRIWEVVGHRPPTRSEHLRAG